MYFALLLFLAAAKDLKIAGNLEVDQSVSLKNLDAKSLDAHSLETKDVETDKVNANSITVDNLTVDRIIPTGGVLKIQGEVIVKKIDSSESATSSSTSSEETASTSSESTAEEASSEEETAEGITMTGDDTFTYVRPTSFIQWEEYSVSTFEDSFQFWDRQDVSSCFEGGDQFLGGHCNFAGDEVSRTYVLPKHNSLRVTAAYHMIDGWKGERGYMKVDGIMAWNHRSTSHAKGINMCGGEDSDRINIPIDVDIPHTAGNLTLTFGSELEVDPCVASFGIDDVVVYYK